MEYRTQNEDKTKQLMVNPKGKRCMFLIRHHQCYSYASLVNDRIGDRGNKKYLSKSESNMSIFRCGQSQRTIWLHGYTKMY